MSDGSVQAIPRKTKYQQGQEELNDMYSGTQGSLMPSNPPGMRQTRAGGMNTSTGERSAPAPESKDHPVARALNLEPGHPLRAVLGLDKPRDADGNIPKRPKPAWADALGMPDDHPLLPVLGIDTSLGQRETPNPSGNVVRIGGKEMSEEEYLKGGSIREQALAEQKRLGREGRGHDLRGGGGKTKDGSFKPSPSVPSLIPSAPPAPPRDRMADASEDDRMAAWAKANPTLAAKVKPGQAGYDSIQKYLNPVTDSTIQDFKDDSGYSLEESEAILKGGSVESVIDSSGISTTITTPQTTSNPASPQDGANPFADISDQYRVLDIPNSDPQEFKSSYMNEKLGEILQGKGTKIPSTYFPK